MYRIRWLELVRSSTAIGNYMITIIGHHILSPRAGLCTRHTRHVPRAPDRERAPRRPLITNFFSVIQKWLDNHKNFTSEFKIANLYVYSYSSTLYPTPICDHLLTCFSLWRKSRVWRNFKIHIWTKLWVFGFDKRATYLSAYFIN